MTDLLDGMMPVPVSHPPGELEAEVFKGVSKAFSPDISVASTIVLPASSLVPVPVLPRDPRRFKGTIINVSSGTSAGSQGASVAGEGAQTAPTAGTAIATTGALAAGTYTVVVQFNFIGAAASGDASNIQLKVGATVITTLPNSDASESVQTFTPVIVSVPAATAVTVNAIANGTAGIVYNALIVATPMPSAASGAPSALIGSPAQVANGVGGLLTAGTKVEVYTGRDYWAVAQGATAVTLLVITETFSQAVPDAET